jgi:hypothetical protein
MLKDEELSLKLLDRRDLRDFWGIDQEIKDIVIYLQVGWGFAKGSRSHFMSPQVYPIQAKGHKAILN